MRRYRHQVWFKDELLLCLNLSLLKSLRVSDRSLNKLKQMYIAKHLLFEKAASIDSKQIHALRALCDLYHQFEFEIQELWGFTRDINFHRFWEFPHCICPRLDNQDAIGTKFHIYSSTCPIHGDKIEDNQ